MDATKFGEELFQYKTQCEKAQKPSYLSRIWSGIKTVAGLISETLIPEITILEEAYDWGNVVYHSICFVQYLEDPNTHTDYQIGYQAGKIFQYFRAALNDIEVLISVDPLDNPKAKRGPMFQLKEETEMLVQNETLRKLEA